MSFSWGAPTRAVANRARLASWRTMRLLRVFLGSLLLLGNGSAAYAAAIAPQLSALAASGPVAVVVGLRHDGSGAAASLSAMRERQSAVLAALPATELSLGHRYETLAGFSATVTEAGLRALADDPEVAWVALDLPGRGALDVSVPHIRADRVHARFVRGADVVIAVIDSGVERDHPDLAGSVIHEECFCRGTCGSGSPFGCKPDCCPDGSARASGVGSAAAGHPHGTHVSAIAVSRGKVAGLGVAPDAKLVAIRVLDENNSGFVSDWVAALDWLAVNRPDVRVVNMSLASLRVFTDDCAERCELDCRPQDGCDPESVCGINRMLADVVARLRQRGTLVVAASGNNSEDNAISTPACVPGVLAVGASTPDDEVAFFSNGGSQLDILAPGVDIVSSGLNGGLSQFCSTVGGQRVCGGTSMAAPHVAGTAALLVSARPSASVARLEEAMIDTGPSILDFRSGRRFPRVDARAAFRAITSTLEVDPGGGSGSTDCLVAWNVIPPDIVRRTRNPVATCLDGDSICDGDRVSGQCTFLLSLCFNNRDPLLPFCSTDQAIAGLELKEPSPQAPLGSVERRNADAFALSLPSFPLDRKDICTSLIPIVVPHDGSIGVASIRLETHTTTRKDPDHFILRCQAK